MAFTSRTLGAGLSKQCTIKKNIEGACGVWSGDETITPQGFHKPTGQHLEAQNQLIKKKTRKRKKNT